MDKTNVLVFSLCALLIGGIIGALAFSDTKVIEVSNDVLIPYEVEKIVEVPVNVLVTDKTLLDKSVNEVLKHLEDEELLTCNGDEYAIDEVSVDKIYEQYSVSYDKDETTVTGSVKLKFVEGDLRSCRNVYDFNVFYEDDEDAVVTILE